MEKEKILDLYTDYLMVSTSLATATGMSKLLEKEISHDKITRFLSDGDMTSKELWQKVKTVVRKVEEEDGVIIFDDSVEEKAYTDENELICWHYDHSVGRTVKGVNQLTLIYHTSISIPVGLEFVKKTKLVYDKKRQKEKRKSETTKHEIYRRMLKTAVKLNQIKFKYILNDNWYACADNMKFIHVDLKKKFIMSIKSNRMIALSLKDKADKKYQSAESLELKAATKVYIEDIDFPLLICKKILKDQDNKEIAIYLITNDLELDSDKMLEIYKKRWKIEEFYKSMKSNCSYSKSPTHTVRTQCNHFFCSVFAVFKYEMIKFRTNINHFALKSKIYLSALKKAFEELKNFKQFMSLDYA